MSVIMQELFATDIGLLSLFTIAFILVMGWYIYKFVKRKMAEDMRAAAATANATAASKQYR